MAELTRERLGALRVQAKELLAADRREVLVCAGTGCIAGGSLKIYDYLKSECEKRGLKTRVALRHEGGDDAIHFKKSGCHGFCEMGPLLQIEPEGFLYTHVRLEDCDEIIERTILGGEAVERLLYELNGVRYAKHNEIPFYAKQQRVVLENCGTTDAEDIDEYLAHDGYAAFEKALFEMSDEDICREILDSGLRGRGGAGFPAGRKWDSVRRQPKGKKYVVCNGDEGDPGAFMDEGIMEGNPHSILEGMMIAAIAVGAGNGYIYVRAEYPLAVERLQKAIDQARDVGLLGENILGTEFSFDIRINRGAGAFVCGEGSALTASIEGNRGMPRTKPPRTVEKGLWAKPTVLNNVETFANIPYIINEGANAYRAIGNAPPLAPRPLRLQETSATPVSSRCLWAQRCARSFSISAAASRTERNSRPCRSAGRAAAVSRRSISISRWTTTRSSTSARSWAPAVSSSWTRTPAWPRSPASS